MSIQFISAMFYLIEVRHELVGLEEWRRLGVAPRGERGLQSADLHTGAADGVQ